MRNAEDTKPMLWEISSPAEEQKCTAHATYIAPLRNADQPVSVLSQRCPQLTTAAASESGGSETCQSIAIQWPCGNQMPVTIVNTAEVFTMRKFHDGQVILTKVADICLRIQFDGLRFRYKCKITGGGVQDINACFCGQDCQECIFQSN